MTNPADVQEVLRGQTVERHLVAPTGNWNWDVRGGTVTWSHELYRMFGVQPGEFDPALEAMECVHPDDRPGIMRTIEAALQATQSYSIVYRVQRSDGSVRVMHSQGYVSRDEQGEPVNVFGTTEDLTERTETEHAIRRSEELLRLVLEAIPVGAAVLDLAGDVVVSNAASSRIWAGMIRAGSERYVRTRAWWHDTGKEIAPHEWASVRALAKGESSINELIDIESFDGIRKVIHNSVVPIRDERQAIIGAVVINEDVSAQKTAEQNLEASVAQARSLTTRLMHAQDDERRRIARMLHEMTAQDLAAMKMLLARVGRSASGLGDDDRELLDEAMEIAERSMSGVRTLSYLLHPPFLDDNGLLSAIRWYAEGFAARSGIGVDLDLPPEFERLQQEVETTLFRVVQEALINVHHHSRSPSARIMLRVDEGRLTLEVRDRGQGMAAELVARLMSGTGVGGVGIAGMRERLQQIAGTLEIESSASGTVVRALVPRHTVGHGRTAHSDR